MQYIINGGKKLSGKATISGNKNSVFPCAAAALLTNQQVILRNVPNIKDTEVLIQILKDLGVKVKRGESEIIVQASEVNHFVLPEDLMVKLRGSVVLVGAMLARAGKVKFSHPGGDTIGQRSINVHLEGLQSLGAKLETDHKSFFLSYSSEPGQSFLHSIFLQEASVTATENLILASVLGNAAVVLKNVAKEPHIVDLCKMLVQMGAQIEGIGTDTLKIMGVSSLTGTTFELSCDYIEASTYAVAAAVTKGKVVLSGVGQADLDPVVVPLKRFGLHFEPVEGGLVVWAGSLQAPGKLHTNLWPGFPTDVMSVAIVLATQASGMTLCHDWMYESRMFFADKLIAMGARIVIADPHRVLVYGPTSLQGKELETPDIRAGMALVLAALSAEGKSIIHRAELIERGYEDVVEKLRGLGASIERRE